MACPDCDMLLHRTDYRSGGSVVCPRCDKTISRATANSIIKVLALSTGGLLIYLPAILMPLMTMKSFGFGDSANIIDSIINFYQTGYYVVAFMVLLSAVIFPFLLLISIFVVSAQLTIKRSPGYLTWLFRSYLHLEEWAMIEVYLLGIVVTIIKISDTSHIYYHSGIFFFSGLVLLTLAIATVIDREAFWQAIGHKDPDRPPEPAVPRYFEADTVVTAVRQGLILCPVCHKLSPTACKGESCPRCGHILHPRKPFSILRTWVLILIAASFLPPANFLPIIRVDFMGIPDRATIMDGIIYFFQHGSYLIGLLIFTASIVVPICKIAGLIFLLFSTRPCSVKLLRRKTRMFRFITFIGRWSMLDIFVIALLSVLVNFGFFSSVHAAPAATYFCIVVITTMLAVAAFDPRIIWDKCTRKE
jgi:paraquat-inducible protein A